MFLDFNPDSGTTCPLLMFKTPTLTADSIPRLIWPLSVGLARGALPLTHPTAGRLVHVTLSIGEPSKQSKGPGDRYRVPLERDISEATEHVQPMLTPLGTMFRARKDAGAKAHFSRQEVPGTGKHTSSRLTLSHLKAHGFSLQNETCGVGLNRFLDTPSRPPVSHLSRGCWKG